MQFLTARGRRLVANMGCFKRWLRKFTGFRSCSRVSSQLAAREHEWDVATAPGLLKGSRMGRWEKNAGRCILLVWLRRPVSVSFTHSILNSSYSCTINVAERERMCNDRSSNLKSKLTMLTWVIQLFTKAWK